MAETETKERPETKAAPKKLSPRSLPLSQHARAEYCVTVDIGITLQDVSRPDFWEHHAKRLTPGDHIEIACEDMTWAAELLVRFKTGNSIVVGVLGFQNFGGNQQAAPQENPEYVIEWNVGKRKHMVRLNESGSEPIGDGHNTKEDAQFWITNHEKALRR